MPFRHSLEIVLGLPISMYLAKGERNMKKAYEVFAAVLIGFCVWIAGAMPAGATDVWVDHWGSENVDIYVMDDTISHGTSSTGRWFNVSTKKVRDGRLLQVIRWEFSQYETDMWRYETNTMDGTHTCAVNTRNRIFEYGMNRIGWPYTIRDWWYY